MLMRQLFTASAVFISFGTLAYGQGLSGDHASEKSEHETFTHAKGNAGGGGGGPQTIIYRGGPVMLGTVHVYYIWYGNWSGNNATTILTDFASTIGGSPYYNIARSQYHLWVGH